MQPPTHPLAPMSTIPVSNITTEQIQKYLDENKQLILAILENQNLGKLAECAQYQAQLQKNLLYLAAIADAQPNAPAVRPQMMMHGSIPQAGHYMQQTPVFPPGVPPQYNPQQMQEQQMHQFQGMVFPGQVGMRPGAVNGIHNMQTEPPHGGIAHPHATLCLAEFPRTGTSCSAVDRRGNKQDANAGEVAVADSHRSSGSEHGSGDADQLHVKRPEEAKMS
ncbi:GRF-interacting factor 2 [Musa troglodytarum]|uniref:GRF-interacting factor 2 n=1 Tax=Musa troglodytarum TaxID=320322 RepID=A0A9E7HET9_9LILI|nr:GRF-interacting factor 2 [Musa troglodytarum]